jgi:hypothetical protein
MCGVALTNLAGIANYMPGKIQSVEKVIVISSCTRIATQEDSRGFLGVLVVNFKRS